MRSEVLYLSRGDHPRGACPPRTNEAQRPQGPAPAEKRSEVSVSLRDRQNDDPRDHE